MKMEIFADDESFRRRLDFIKYGGSTYSVLACEHVKLFLYHMGKLHDLMEVKRDGSYIITWPAHLVKGAAMSILRLDSHHHHGVPMLIPALQLFADSRLAELIFGKVLSMAISWQELTNLRFVMESLQESSWLFEHRWDQPFGRQSAKEGAPPKSEPEIAPQLLPGGKKKKRERPRRGAVVDYPMAKSRG